MGLAYCAAEVSSQHPLPSASAEGAPSRKRKQEGALCGQRAVGEAGKGTCKPGTPRGSAFWSHHSLEQLTKAGGLLKRPGCTALVSGLASGGSLLEFESRLSHLVAV